MNRAMSRASRNARDRRSVAVDFGIGDRGRQLHERVGVDRLGLLAGDGSASAGGSPAVLLAPGRVAVGLGQSPMGGDVFGIDGERAAVGGDRLLEIVAPFRARDRQLDACPGVERGTRAR